MIDWRSLLISLLIVGVLVLLLRWAFSGRHTSLVERRPGVGDPTDYGLLVPVAAPRNFVDGEIVRRRLLDAGLRASLVSTSDGPRVMVFPEDEKTARAVLAD